ncbi:MAG: non-canonical purine NTP pyrophosphatase, RdgB/HAM1 family [Candidatus Marinimicrobia bacterium]|nr:non-canonical purine NTP pyrophosphatase, RdgB/HAM1 family [Candidatus Neomarinimicrobiota bacterium]|tara:strand:- start:32637 stop:33263 length:627 start_codon:yes stop_codon:yes gene_type:complete
MIVPDRQKLVLATHNLDKRIEMKSLLSDLDLDIIGLDKFPDIDNIPENGATLLENALIKANTVYFKTGLPALSDDTGLEVDVLNGEPGIYSARFAGKNATYQDNLQKLLTVMSGIPLKNRTARFRTVVALVVDNNTELWTEGTVEGLITIKQRGTGGFGYDPVFEEKDTKKTFSEMTILEKNNISHRSIALKKMHKKLNTIFKKKEYR